jgi:hypothetical protein
MGDNIRYAIVNNVTKIIDKMPIKNESIGNGLRQIHSMCLMRFMVIIVITSNIKLIQKFCLFFVILFILQIVFNDCIITDIEQKLLKDNKSIIDIILTKFNYDINKKNRYNANVILLISIIILILFKYKFLLNKK